MIGYCRNKECNDWVEAKQKEQEWESINMDSMLSQQIDNEWMGALSAEFLKSAYDS